MDEVLSNHQRARIALLRRGDPSDTLSVLSGTCFAALGEAFAAIGAEARLVNYSDAAVDAVRAVLLGFDAVLVWIDPIHSDGADRAVLDPMLEGLVAHGLFVSARPQVILKMGVKAVLWRTRGLGWGADTHLYDSVAAFRDGFPGRLQSTGPRVLKQNRGNGGHGVWRVAAADEDAGEPMVEIIAARDDHARRMRLSAFMAECEACVGPGRPLIDQAWQPRVGEGMVRCYLSRDRVVGFSEQFPRSRELLASDASAVTFGMASAKRMHDASARPFQDLRAAMEDDWVPGLVRLLELTVEDLPVLWDADFLYGPPRPDGEDSFVLCEINVSSVSPFPDAAAPAVTRAALDAGLAARDAWAARWRPR